MAKNPPSNAGHVSSIPGGGTEIPHVVGQLSLTLQQRPVQPNKQTNKNKEYNGK